MKAKSIKGKSFKDISPALSEAMNVGFRPTLALVFLSINQDREEICNLLDSKEIAVFGATTNGEFIHDEHDTSSTAIILIDLNPKYFTILFDEFHGKNFSATAEKRANKSLEFFANPAFLVIVSHPTTDAEEIISGFENILGKEVNLFGGLAGDDYSFTNQYVFTNRKSSEKGILTIALDEARVMIKGRATHGWKAAGTLKTVTKSEGNHVYTVDIVPVLDMTKKFGGLEELAQENADSIKELGNIATNFPLQLQREKGAPVMRPGLQIDWEDGSFYCGGNVPQGSKVRFSLPPDFDVIEKAVDELNALKEKDMPEADSVALANVRQRCTVWNDKRCRDAAYPGQMDKEFNKKRIAKCHL